MSRINSCQDLIVLAADANMEHTIKGLLARSQALEINPIGAEIFIHPHRDPGCLNKAVEFLRPFIDRYDHALVLFDRIGCGAEGKSRIELENQLENRLASNGWGSRAAAVVLDPELEVWVWSDSPEVDQILGWCGHIPDLRSWLQDKGLWQEGDLKPGDPKKAMEEALRFRQKSRSSAYFLKLASSVSFRRCSDQSFLKLCNTLREWFLRTDLG